jgi:uncharacterized membrane protein YebE (DUF533 family)
MPLEELMKAVPNSQTAIEVYAASQDYLSRLASSMFIPPELVKAVHAQAELIS